MTNIDAMLRALGLRIAMERKRRGLQSQKALADLAGITERQMGKIERGERGQLAEVWKVADALEMNFSDLVEDAESVARRDVG